MQTWCKLSPLFEENSVNWKKIVGRNFVAVSDSNTNLIIEFNLLDFLFNTHIYLERDSYIPYEQGKF